MIANRRRDIIVCMCARQALIGANRSRNDDVRCAVNLAFLHSRADCAVSQARVRAYTDTDP